jgi:hydrogenase-4 component E
MSSGHPLWVSQVVTFLTALALVCSFAMLALRSLHLCIRVYAAQSILLGLAGLLLGGEGFGMGLLAIGLKGFVIPWFLFKVMGEVGIRRENDPFVPPALSLGIGVALALLSYAALSAVPRLTPAVSGGFALSLTLMLLGLWSMAVARKVIAQIVGVLVVENGLFVAAISTAFSLPVIVELGLAFDLLVAVVVSSLLVSRIRQTYLSIDSERLSRDRKSVV